MGNRYHILTGVTMTRIFRVGQRACPPSPKFPEGYRVGVPVDSNVPLLWEESNSGGFGTRISSLRRLNSYENIRRRRRSDFRDGGDPASSSGDLRT